MKKQLLIALFIGLIAVSCGGKKEKKVETVQDEVKVEAPVMMEEADSAAVEVADSLQMDDQMDSDSIQ